MQSVSKGDREKYASMAHQLPVLIRTAGLAQALAFVQSRKDPSLELLLTHLALVILDAPNRTNPRVNVALLSSQALTAPLLQYMLLTERSLTALLWFKRFAESVWNISPINEPLSGEAPGRSGGPA
jgi:CRISPR-associated protein Cmr5